MTWSDVDGEGSCLVFLPLGLAVGSGEGLLLRAWLANKDEQAHCCLAAERMADEEGGTWLIMHLFTRDSVLADKSSSKGCRWRSGWSTTSRRDESFERDRGQGGKARERLRLRSWSSSQYSSCSMPADPCSVRP